ncbi:MAG: hypothetical protein A3K83_03145 [Omnitrophica WOR_2 bacterium RBG_13_44_8b]|nr:MAG: hypothetical protein A3K83_03145 [Omnitrophica WOR_2 bacterium RBG_13_44_8b]
MQKLTIRVIAFLEVLIGFTTLSSLITFQVYSVSTKPMNVFIFVLVSSLISIIIGFELMNYKNSARKALLFFSMYIVFTKLLIFANLLQFKGEIITFISGPLKNSTSLLYHSFILLLFNQPKVKEIFKS